MLILLISLLWVGCGYGIYRLLLCNTADEPMNQRAIREHWYMAVFLGPIILISSGYLCLTDLWNSWRDK